MECDVDGAKLFPFGDIASERLPNELDLGELLEGKAEMGVEIPSFVPKPPSTEETGLESVSMTT
jgi:hypothetical protein